MHILFSKTYDETAMVLCISYSVVIHRSSIADLQVFDCSEERFLYVADGLVDDTAETYFEEVI